MEASSLNQIRTGLESVKLIRSREGAAHHDGTIMQAFNFPRISIVGVFGINCIDALAGFRIGRHFDGKRISGRNKRLTIA